MRDSTRDKRFAAREKAAGFYRALSARSFFPHVPSSLLSSTPLSRARPGPHSRGADGQEKRRRGECDLVGVGVSHAEAADQDDGAKTRGGGRDRSLLVLEGRCGAIFGR